MVYLANDQAKAIAQPINVQPSNRLTIKIDMVFGCDLAIATAVGSR